MVLRTQILFPMGGDFSLTAQSSNAEEGSVSNPDSGGPRIHQEILAQSIAQATEATSAASLGRRIVRSMTGRGLSLSQAFGTLSGVEREQLGEVLGPRTAGEMLSLSRYQDRQSFANALHALAGRQERQGRLNLAGTLYSALTALPDAGAWADLAETQIQVIQGQGSWSDRAGFITRNLCRQLSDLGLFAGFMVGGGVFRNVYFGTLSSLGRSTMGARALAWSVGFAAEVPSFTLAMRGVHEMFYRPQDWSPSALGQDLIHNGVGLFALKGTGAIGHRALRAFRATNLASGSLLRAAEIAIPQSTMFTGLLAARGASMAIGWEDPKGFWDIFPEIVASQVHFNVMGQFYQWWYGGTPLPGFSGRNLPGLDAARSPLETPWTRWMQNWNSSLGRRFASANQTPLPEGVALMEAHVGESSSPPPRPNSSFPPPGRLGLPIEVPPARSLGAKSFTVESLDLVEHEIWELFRLKEPRSDWARSSQRWSEEIRRILVTIESQPEMDRPKSQNLDTLRALNLELRHLEVFLGYLNGKSKSLNGNFPHHRSPLVQRFLEDLYRSPSTLIDYVQMGDGIELPLITTQRARATLNEVYHSIYGKNASEEGMATGTPADLHPILLAEGNRISGELFRLFFLGSHETAWIPVAYRHAIEFRNLLEFTRDAYRLDPAQESHLEGLDQALSETHQVAMSMEPLVGEAPEVTAGISQRAVIHYLYNGPNAFINFLNSMDPAMLEATAQQMAYTRQAVVDPASME